MPYNVVVLVTTVGAYLLGSFVNVVARKKRGARDGPAAGDPRAAARSL
jgi:hypothetical protein